MRQPQLETPYRRYLELLDQGAEAIERQDLETLEAVASASAAVLAEMRNALAELETQARSGGAELEAESLVSLDRLMRDAVRRSERNQEQIATWKAQTQESLCALRAGSVAMAGYAGVALLQPKWSVHTQG